MRPDNDRDLERILRRLYEAERKGTGPVAPEDLEGIAAAAEEDDPVSGRPLADRDRIAAIRQSLDADGSDVTPSAGFRNRILTAATQRKRGRIPILFWLPTAAAAALLLGIGMSVFLNPQRTVDDDVAVGGTAPDRTPSPVTQRPSAAVDEQERQESAPPPPTTREERFADSNEETPDDARRMRHDRSVPEAETPSAAPREEATREDPVAGWLALLVDANRRLAPEAAARAERMNRAAHEIDHLLAAAAPEEASGELAGERRSAESVDRSPESVGRTAEGGQQAGRRNSDMEPADSAYASLDEPSRRALYETWTHFRKEEAPGGSGDGPMRQGAPETEGAAGSEPAAEFERLDRQLAEAARDLEEETQEMDRLQAFGSRGAAEGSTTIRIAVAATARVADKELTEASRELPFPIYRPRTSPEGFMLAGSERIGDAIHLLYASTDLLRTFSILEWASAEGFDPATMDRYRQASLPVGDRLLSGISLTLPGTRILLFTESEGIDLPRIAREIQLDAAARLIETDPLNAGRLPESLRDALDGVTGSEAPPERE